MMIIIMHIYIVYLKLLLWGGKVLCFHYVKSSMSGFHCQSKDILSIIEAVCLSVHFKVVS